MSYFKNITSLSELKKQYRTLTLANHPDRGGKLEIMQCINSEFEKLFNVWKDRPQSTCNGYENDYKGATARQYTEHVYNEYKWKGHRYKGQGNKEITASIRKWLKETYPDYKFSVRLEHYSAIYVSLLIADFDVYVQNAVKRPEQIYRIDDNEFLSDRAKDVLGNVKEYILSFNYDDSDIMTDYFNTNFYYYIRIGSDTSPYRIEIGKSRRTGGAVSPEFKRPEGPAHKSIKKALGNAYFSQYTYNGESYNLLGVDKYYSEKTFYPLDYSSISQAKKRVEKLLSAGIICRILGRKYFRIEFVGYTPEVEKALSNEDQAADAAQKEWENSQRKEINENVHDNNSTKTDQNKTAEKKEENMSNKTPYGNNEISQNFSIPEGLELVDYSEKAIALFGNTRSIKYHLNGLGRFNPGLNYGNGKRAGWVFSKSKTDSLINVLNRLSL